MIVVDTSAFMAVALDEPAAEACSHIMAQADEIAVSAGTLAETLIVASRRNVRPAMERLISGLGCQVVPVTEHDAFKVAEAYSAVGQGRSPSGSELRRLLCLCSRTPVFLSAAVCRERL
jgi:ribonuclease VapC